VPSVVADLSEGISAALEVRITAHVAVDDGGTPLPDPRGPDLPVPRRAGVAWWAGTWLASGDHVVAVRPSGVSAHAPEVDLFSTGVLDPAVLGSAAVEPAVRLMDLDGEGLHRDLLSGVTAAWSTQLAVWEGGLRDR
jgi:hypothetical protein